MSKFKDMTKQLDDLFKQLSDNRTRRQAAQERIESAKAAIGNTDEALRKAILTDDSKAVKAYESEIAKLQSSVVNRDEILMEELDREFKDLESAVSEKQAAQKKHFAENAAKILSAEIGTHDRLARELIVSTKRLLSLYQLVRYAGHPEVYRDALGDALTFIPQSQIPVISGFNRSQYLSASHFSVTIELLNKLSSEIEEV